MNAIVASIPSPSSSSISIGPLELRAYGLLIALGVIAAVWLCGRRLEQRGLGTTDDASSIGMWGVAAGIVGARLYHVATEWDRFSDDLGAIPKIWEGGLGIPGGLVFGTLAGLWQGKRRGIDPGALMTCAAPAIPLAQAIGRVGNWFNQELYGRPTDLPWALEIDDAHLPPGYASGTTFHPTFLYEALWNLGLAGLLIWVDRRFRLGPGRLMALYVVGYGLGRFWVEGLRIDPADELAGLRWNQWVALAAIAGGAVWLYLTRGRTWPASADGVVEADDAPIARHRGVADPDVADPDMTDPETTDPATTDRADTADATDAAESDAADPARSRPVGDGDAG